MITVMIKGKVKRCGNALQESMNIPNCKPTETQLGPHCTIPQGGMVTTCRHTHLGFFSVPSCGHEVCKVHQKANLATVRVNCQTFIVVCQFHGQQWHLSCQVHVGSSMSIQFDWDILRYRDIMGYIGHNTMATTGSRWPCFIKVRIESAIPWISAVGMSNDHHPKSKIARNAGNVGTRQLGSDGPNIRLKAFNKNQISDGTWSLPFPWHLRPEIAGSQVSTSFHTIVAGGALTLVFSYSQSNFPKFPIFQQKQMNHGFLF